MTSGRATRFGVNIGRFDRKREKTTPAIWGCTFCNRVNRRKGSNTAVPAKCLWCLQTNDPEKRAKTARHVPADTIVINLLPGAAEPIRVLPAWSGTSAPGCADEQTMVINNFLLLFSNTEPAVLYSDRPIMYGAQRTVRGLAVFGTKRFFISLLFFFSFLLHVNRWFGNRCLKEIASEKKNKKWLEYQQTKFLFFARHFFKRQTYLFFRSLAANIDFPPIF